MNDTEFEMQADAQITRLCDALEVADEQGDIELETDTGMISVVASGAKTWLVSKHGPSKQLWLSSPFSGGLHFDYDAASNKWKLNDGRSLSDVLFGELRDHIGLDLT